jgi:hypothetical protein
MTDEKENKNSDMDTQAIFGNQLKMVLSPEMINLVEIVVRTAGYTLPPTKEEYFRKFHTYITNPEPKFITSWRASKKTEYLYHRLVSGVLTDTQNAFMAVNYHFEKIVNIEKTVIETLDKRNYKEFLGDSAVAFGNSLALDFEFQSFVLAYRRCLDLLTRAMSSFFRQEFHSFRKLPKVFISYNPLSVATALIEVHEKYAKDFKFVLSEEGEKSIRDLISHYKFVNAGAININKFGFKFAGINEQLFDRLEANDSFSTILDRKLNALGHCIKDMLDAFVKEVELWDTMAP